MKCLKSTILMPLLVTPFLLVSALNTQEYENQSQVPGNLEVEIQNQGYTPNTYSDRNGSFPRSQEINNPVCNAIKHQKRMEMLVENQEILNKREMRIVTNKYVVEPYAFGMTNDGKPVFYGKVIEEKLEKDMTVKFGIDKFDDKTVASSSEKKQKITSGWFGTEKKGWFGKDKNVDIDIRNIKGVKVIENSHFDAPKEYLGFNQPNVQVLCQLPITKQ